MELGEIFKQNPFDEQSYWTVYKHLCSKEQFVEIVSKATMYDLGDDYFVKSSALLYLKHLWPDMRSYELQLRLIKCHSGVCLCHAKKINNQIIEGRHAMSKHEIDMLAKSDQLGMVLRLEIQKLIERVEPWTELCDARILFFYGDYIVDKSILDKLT